MMKTGERKVRLKEEEHDTAERSKIGDGETNRAQEDQICRLYI